MPRLGQTIEVGSYESNESELTAYILDALIHLTMSERQYGFFAYNVKSGV